MIQRVTNFWNKRISQVSSTRLIVFACIYTAVIYVLLHTNYYLYYVDDAWEMAKSYYFIHQGITEDVLFRHPDAADRTQVFCTTFYFIYGHILEFIGWTKGNAHLLSSIFLLFGAAVWFFILKTLHFSKPIRCFFFFGVLLMPAFFNASHLARADALAFFLASSAFWLFLKKQHFLAGFTVLFALESHTMGAIGGFYIAAYVLAEHKRYLAHWKQSALALIAFILGMSLGVCYYFWVQGDTWTLELFQEIMEIKRNMKTPFPSYFFNYFIQTRWFRHFWEFILIAFSLQIFLKQKLYKQNSFVGIFLVVLFISSFLTGRANKNYMIFMYPAFLLLIVFTFERLKKLKELALGLLVTLTILYGAHFIAFQKLDYQETINKTAELIPNDHLPVIGMPENWFAVVGREFYPIYHSVTYLPSFDIPELYLVKNDYISHHSKNYAEMIDYFNHNYQVSSLGKFEVYSGSYVEVYHCIKK